MTVTVERQDTGTRWVFDAVPKEGYRSSIKVSSHPIEDGSQVSDHAQSEPLRIKLEGVVTEHPKPSAFRSGLSNRTVAALEFFRELEGVLVSVTSQDLGVFRDLLLTGFPHEIDITEGTVLRASFQQTEIATAQRIELPPKQPPESKAKEMPDQQNLGKQGTGRYEKSNNAGKDAAKQYLS